nr:ArsR family transcriptional regulator [Nocardia nova]
MTTLDGSTGASPTRRPHTAATTPRTRGFKPRPPKFVHLAAHPLRWQLLTELSDSDYRVRELVARVGEPQNLISYHLRLLRDGGLVTAIQVFDVELE